MRIREALAKAIENSVEGKAMSAEDMAKIKVALGAEGDLDEAKFVAPLSRRELKSIIDMVDTAVDHGEKLIDKLYWSRGRAGYGAVRWRFRPCRHPCRRVYASLKFKV